MMVQARSVIVSLIILSGLLMTLDLRMEADRSRREGTKTRPVYRSPFALAVSPDGRTIYVSDHTARCVVVIDCSGNGKLKEIPVRGEPTGLALSTDGRWLFVSEYGAGTVAVISTEKGKVVNRIKVGLRPMGLALADKSSRLFVCNHESASVSVVDMVKSKPLGQIAVLREPMFAAVTPDEKRLVVTNMLPLGRATDPAFAAKASIIDVARLKLINSIKLPPGSTNVMGVCVSPDGHWAYVVHSLGRFNVPTTQLERGWVNTNALTILDLVQGERYATTLLDFLTEGAADPFGVVCSPDGKRLWVSLSGTHQIAVIELARLRELLAGKVPQEMASQFDASTQNSWQLISKSPSPESREMLTDDLTALYVAGAIQRVDAGGKGPRGLALSPAGHKLYVANYFSGSVTALATDNSKQLATIAVGPQPEPDLVRRGEMVFHDALGTFQHWLSCATCHPGDGRVDALNWDLLNDGIGNPKNNKSLLLAHKTPPMMWRAVRENFEVAVRAGFRFIEFSVPPEENVQAAMAYISSLKPEPSPFLGPDGNLTPSARRGNKLFEGRARCAGCHPAPLFTNLKQYDVGTKSDQDTDPDGIYDTPTLIEVYRTAPYLHDGRAVTMKEVLTTWNKGDKHGKTSQLSEREIDDLVAYILSL